MEGWREGDLGRQMDDCGGCATMRAKDTMERRALVLM